MGILTPFFNLFKPAKTDPLAVAKINEDLDIIDTEMHKPPLTVNEVEPDANRNIYLETVPLAQNLASDDAKLNIGTFIERTTGGDASIDDGDAFLSTIKGNMVKTGYVAESIEMTVTPATREEGETPITATLDRDTFVAYVATSGTITLTYTTAWSANPSLYGITVTGTPISGDVITVVYVKEDRGTITTATPATFNSTGWNLYNNTAGYAKVVKYSNTYGFKLGGTYNLVEFAETVSGTRTTLTLENGYFTVPSDGYVFVTGGDATTYIYATCSDWIDGYEGSFQTYTVDTIDLTSIMVSFPYGLLAVGNVRDEINANTQLAISRVTRLAYTDENLAAVIASGVDYDTDTNYIYAVRENPVSSSIELDGTYTVSDHGIEFFTGTTIPVITEVLYGENLKDYLRHDVPDAIADINAKNSTEVFSAFASQSALETALVTLGSSMSAQQFKNIWFNFNPAPTSGAFATNNGFYIGTIKKNAADRYTVEVQCDRKSSSTASGDLVVGVYYNSLWTWHNISNEIDALNSNMLKKTSLKITSGNLDDYYGDDKAGLYYVGAGVTNSQFDYSGLIVIAQESYGAQIQFNYRTVVVRTRTGNPATWSDWSYLSQSLENGYVGASQTKTYALTARITYILTISNIASNNIENIYTAMVVAPPSSSNTGKVVWLTSTPPNSVTVSLSGFTLTVASSSSIWITVALTRM